jgi:hypothetical protein
MNDDDDNEEFSLIPVDESALVDDEAYDTWLAHPLNQHVLELAAAAMHAQEHGGDLLVTHLDRELGVQTFFVIDEALRLRTDQWLHDEALRGARFRSRTARVPKPSRDAFREIADAARVRRKRTSRPAKRTSRPAIEAANKRPEEEKKR